MTASMLAGPLLALLLSTTMFPVPQTAAGPSGHWKGTLQVPGQALEIEIDLARKGDTWEGAIAIPAQSLKGFPLSAIAVQGDRVSFAMSGVPGAPQFSGALSKDAKSLAGDFTQGGATIPFTVARTGDAKLETLPKSTPIPRELEGAWEGAIDVNGQTLHLALKLANSPQGPATGTLVSIDQGGAEIPIPSIVLAGTHLKLIVRAVAGTWDGEVGDRQLTGTWVQGPLNVPLVFKRPAPAR
ncbi:MAG: hypothetical protein ABI818_15900 [Acidobacteriota bacterium]